MNYLVYIYTIYHAAYSYLFFLPDSLLPTRESQIQLQTDTKYPQIILNIECFSLLFAVIFFASAWGPAFSAFSAFFVPALVGLSGFTFLLFVKF